MLPNRDGRGPVLRAVNRHDHIGLRPLTADGVSRIVRQLGSLTTSTGTDRRFSGHSLRATFVTLANENGASLENIARVVGHSSTAATSSYIRRESPWLDNPTVGLLDAK